MYGFTELPSGLRIVTARMPHLASIALGIWVGTGLMPSNSKAAQRNDINYVGSFSGAMAQVTRMRSPRRLDRALRVLPTP